MLHGRGGRFSGLQHIAIDWFAPTLLVTLHEDQPINKPLLADLRAIAIETPDIVSMVVQERFPSSRSSGEKHLIYGPAPSSPLALEHGLRYQLDLERNHNHGFFLDMKPGREWVRSVAGSKSVLNLFAYTCSLSVAALAGGARSVFNLDMARRPLGIGRKNHQLNFDQSTCSRASYLPHDLFKSWGRLKRHSPFDILIVDPPSNQKGSFVIDKDYPKIARRLVELTHPQSRILACVNSPYHDIHFLEELFCDYRHQQRLPQAIGFEDQNPEAGLKMVIFEPKQ